jgi:hypothetical protein
MAIGARKCLLLISTTLQVPSRVLLEVYDSAWAITECLEHFVAISKRTGLVDRVYQSKSELSTWKCT